MKIIGFAGWSGSGKTNLIVRLLTLIKKKNNFKASTIKHAHEKFDMDQPGKDSYLHKKAGASEVIVSSSKRWAVIHELNKNEKELSLDELINKVSKVDLLFVEGWKNSSLKKIEVYRPEINKPLLCINDKNIIAIASSSLIIQKNLKIPVFDVNNTQDILQFILNN